MVTVHRTSDSRTVPTQLIPCGHSQLFILSSCFLSWYLEGCWYVSLFTHLPLPYSFPYFLPFSLFLWLFLCLTLFCLFVSFIACFGQFLSMWIKSVYLQVWNEVLNIMLFWKYGVLRFQGHCKEASKDHHIWAQREVSAVANYNCCLTLQSINCYLSALSN